MVIDLFKTRNLLDNSQQAPNFILPKFSTDGQPGPNVNLIEKGKKTILYFWAPWCSVCKLSINNLNSLKNESTNVYAVALSYRSKEEIQQIISDKKVTVDVVLGTDAVEQAYRVEAFPTIYMIDKEGKIKTKTLGYTTSLGMQLRL